jgi:hypothetical protein
VIFEPPIFINCRDRVTDLRALVEWLEKAGHERIILLDNDSSYPPLLEYLEQTPHRVTRMGGNFGSRALWRAGMVPNEPFVYTDPDIVPTEECPLDAVAYLAELMERYPAYVKVALGLYLEDVPNFKSLPWERALVGGASTLAHHADSHLLEEGVYSSLSDTTFALWRPRSGFIHRCIRLGAPSKYMARHTSWYRLDDPTEEEKYYLERAVKGPLGSSWADGGQ